MSTNSEPVNPIFHYPVQVSLLEIQPIIDSSERPVATLTLTTGTAACYHREQGAIMSFSVVSSAQGFGHEVMIKHHQAVFNEKLFQGDRQKTSAPEQPGYDR